MIINGNWKQICNRERLLFTGWISGVALRESRATSTKATVPLNAQIKYINVHQIFAERPILQTEHVTKGQNPFTLNACHDKYSVDQEKPSNFISNMR